MHPRINTEIITCLRTRAERACKGENVIKEKEHLYNVFVANGHPEEMTRKSLINNPKAKEVSQTEEEGARTNTLCQHHTSRD